MIFMKDPPGAGTLMRVAMFCGDLLRTAKVPQPVAQMEKTSCT